ncbi:MAG: hypothetical protein KJO25_03380, partial [Bacteroidia bacterium]|nr:hypothetical protein [Bacteroidia bacterium]
MRKKLLLLFGMLFFLGVYVTSAQEIPNEPQSAADSGTLEYRFVPSIAEQIRTGTFIPAQAIPEDKLIGQPRMRHTNKVVPGKGSRGPDVLAELQKNAPQRQMRGLSNSFVSTSTGVATPSDPTGAVGADFYIAAWNISFQIYNKDGTPAAPAAAPGTLFGGENIGDQIALYDAAIDRYIITQFSSSPNGFHIAISQTNDPVNGGWHVYLSSGFTTGAFPDYTKFSIWSDGYYVTSNITGGNGQVWALERDKMITGDPTASYQAFFLPGISTSGFYSPQAFNVSDGNLPAAGDATIVYMQDDAWAGVANDHLKLWNLDIDWVTPANSTMSAATEIPVTPFIGVFDGGDFSNLQQPSGPDIDAIQATIMNQAQFRKFGTHNSVVFNFVVDTDPGAGELAAVRWYEMRQTADGQPWTIYQEGTYNAPDGRHAWNASMAMDSNGNIGMGYSSMSNTESVSSRFTGRFATDPLNVMTGLEGLISLSTGNSGSLRYADYSHLTVDSDDTFWFVNEVFTPTRSNIVGVFTVDPPLPDDVGVSSIDAPTGGVLTSTEQITVSIRNFGTNPQSNIPVSYTIDAGTPVNEVFAGPLNGGETASYTFTQTADLSIDNQTYTITASTNLAGDGNTSNDSVTVNVTNALSYCEPSSNCSFNDGVTLFQLGTIDHVSPTNCGADTDGYIDSRGVMTDLDRATGFNVYTGNLQVGWGGDEASIFIDYNDDGDFEDAGELVLDGVGSPISPANSDYAFSITIPTDANLGMHVMRVRGWDPAFPAAGSLNNPCDNLTYGRTEDFTVNIIDTSLSTADFTLDGSEFEIITKPNNQFEIQLTTPYTDKLSVSVYNMLGQTVA